MSNAYEYAKELYAKLGVDTDAAIAKAKLIPIGMHCWQGDDVGGFEEVKTTLEKGTPSPTNYVGKARNLEELRADFVKAASLIPGAKRVNVHACYLDNGGKKIDRTEMEPKHFDSWINWAKEHGYGMDFKPTCFAHPNTVGGTLSNPDKAVRDYWIEHCRISRRIAEYIGRETNDCIVNSLWIPDGMKDIPADRYGARLRLTESLDTIYGEKMDNRFFRDSMESSLFGLGAESFTVGSHDYYLGYAIRNNLMYTLDSGHFHPTEVVADKISAIMCFLDEMVLHVSRPVRHDSDHVLMFDDQLKALAHELIRRDMYKKVHIALDYCDGTINRLASWVIGIRNLEMSLLQALLEPTETLIKLEEEGNYTYRLALMSELEAMPFTAVWERYCEECGVPVGLAWLDEVKDYEKTVLVNR